MRSLRASHTCPLGGGLTTYYLLLYTCYLLPTTRACPWGRPVNSPPRQGLLGLRGEPGRPTWRVRVRGGLGPPGKAGGSQALASWPSAGVIRVRLVMPQGGPTLWAASAWPAPYQAVYVFDLALRLSEGNGRDAVSQVHVLVLRGASASGAVNGGTAREAVQVVVVVVRAVAAIFGGGVDGGGGGGGGGGGDGGGDGGGEGGGDGRGVEVGGGRWR